MKKLSAIIVLSILLVTCQSIPLNDQGRLSTGTVFHLNQALRFFPSQVAIYFQDGQIVRPNSVDDYRPNCTIEVWKKLAHEQTIRSDIFTIAKVRYRSDIAGTPHYANRISLSGPIDFQEYATDIFLHSAGQPNVYKLSCQHLEDHINARHLTIVEMQQALGNIITITIPE